MLERSVQRCGSRRRHALVAAVVTLTLAIAVLGSTGTPSTAAANGQDEVELRFGSQQIYGPDRPEDTAAWLDAMKRWRADERDRVGFDPANYERPELKWAQRNPIQPQVMVEDRYLYDKAKGEYTVDRYLADVRRRYGGIDSVLIWPTYPNIGTDNRNTEDMFRAMPGGWSGVRTMVRDFHRAGVRVLFPIMIWDHGTRDPGRDWAEVLPEMLADAGADGLNGDTMNAVTKDYFDNSVADGRPLVLEPELGVQAPRDNLMWNTQSWGYWDNRTYAPMVSINKWMEPRHTVHVNDRWSTSKIDMLQLAFFNGTGLESWENIWGIWNQLTDRDGEATKRVATIEREFPDLLVSQGWEPHTPTVQSDKIFASKWPGSDETLWTMVNRSTDDTDGDQLVLPHTDGVHYYDVWHGVELDPRIENGQATLTFPIEAKGFGAVLASRPEDLPAGFAGFMGRMHDSARRTLASFSPANTVLRQKMTPIATTAPRGEAPAGMTLIPGADYTYNVRGTEIEGGDRAGVDVQYPWESQPGRYHTRTMAVRPFYMDKTPVTNGEYQRFIDTTGYRPKDSTNFLKDWDWSDPRRPAYRDGYRDKPVTWVSIEDSRAYADWAGKRLPHSWEWQYAAQGLDGRNYPWGNSWDAAKVPQTFSGRGDLRPPDDVDAHPDGASPYGVLDLVGNVWQWTDEFTDDHTRAAVLRGGSYYRALGSGWYFPSDQTAYRLDHHNKYLLMSPGRDRAATIGFRTVVDARGPGPRPISDGTVVDDNAPGWQFEGWPRYGDVDGYREGAHGGAGAHGQSASYTFDGTGVDVYGWRGPNGGTIRVLVDGEQAGEPISQHAATDRYHQLLTRVGGLTPGTHTVRIETDDRTGADEWTMVDYLRTYDGAQPPAPPTVSLDRSATPPGSTVTVTATFRNESDAPVSGRLSLSAPAGLRVSPEATTFKQLAPHESVSARFRIEVGADAASGAQLLRAVASLNGHASTEGWANLTVLGSVDPVNATAGRGNWIDLSWRSLDADGATTYEVYAATSPDFTPGPDTLIATATKPTFTHTGLETDQTWYYRVRATDGAGAAGPYSHRTSATSGSVVILEAEGLPPSEATAPYTIQDNCCGLSWSGGKQVWFQANAPGDRYTLTFDVPKAGQYDVTLVYTKAWDFGIQSRTLDGEPLGETYDHALPAGVALDRQTYGPRDLAAGSHQLTFTVTGKRDSSPRYGFGLDAIELTPAGG